MRGDNMETMGLIIADLLENFCAYIIPSLIFAMLMGCLFWNIQKNGIRNVIISYLTEIRYNRRLIYQFLFFLYVYFIFDRTLLSRHFGWPRPFFFCFCLALCYRNQPRQRKNSAMPMPTASISPTTRE